MKRLGSKELQELDDLLSSITTTIDKVLMVLARSDSDRVSSNDRSLEEDALDIEKAVMELRLSARSAYRYMVAREDADAEK